MQLKKKLLSTSLVISLLTPFLSSPAMAQEAACKGLGGSVIFRDMLYGIGIGGIIGGLIVAANDQSNAGKTVAYGALAGSGLGLGFGIYEFATRDCSDVSTNKQRHEFHHHNYQHSGSNFGWETPKLSYQPSKAAGMSSWSLDVSYRF